MEVSFPCSQFYFAIIYQGLFLSFFIISLRVYATYLDKVYRKNYVLVAKIEPEVSCGRKLLLCFMISNSIEKEVMKRAFLLEKVFRPPPSCWYIKARTHANWFSTDQRLLTLECVDHILEHFFYVLKIGPIYAFLEHIVLLKIRRIEQISSKAQPEGTCIDLLNEALPRNLV